MSYAFQSPKCDFPSRVSEHSSYVRVIAAMREKMKDNQQER